LSRDELVAWADSRGIARDAYTLDGGHQSETLVLDRRGPFWVVYYSERGFEHDLTSFGHESDALGHIRARLEAIAPITSARHAD
jgi:hypothetical protein